MSEITQAKALVTHHRLEGIVVRAGQVEDVVRALLGQRELSPGEWNCRSPGRATASVS